MTLQSVLDQMAKAGTPEDVRWKCLAYLLKQLCVQTGLDLEFDDKEEK